MVKYVKIEDDDIIEIEREQYCWNCEWFCAPNGCTNLFMGTVPFSFCDGWSRASDEELESIKKVINECCEIKPLREMRDYKRALKGHKKDIIEIYGQYY